MFTTARRLLTYDLDLERGREMVTMKHNAKYPWLKVILFKSYRANTQSTHTEIKTALKFICEISLSAQVTLKSKVREVANERLLSS